MKPKSIFLTGDITKEQLGELEKEMIKKRI